MPEVPSARILGIPVHMLDMERALSLAESRIRSSAPGYICHLDVRSVLAARDDLDVRAALAGAALAVPDGMPLVWIGRRRGFHVSRIYGPEFMEGMFGRTDAWNDRRCRHALLGGRPEARKRLAERLKARFPGVDLADFDLPEFPWSEDEDLRIASRLNQSAADVVWVAMSAPKQELWMARNRARLHAPLLVGVGAAFDFLSGSTPQAPRWLRQCGLEWAFRAATEPRRLGARYLRTVPRFAVLALGEEWRMARRRSDGDS